MRLEELTNARITDLRDAIVRNGDLELLHPNEWSLADFLQIVRFKEFCSLYSGEEDWCFRASRITLLSIPTIVSDEMATHIKELKVHSSYYFSAFSKEGFSVGKEMIARELVARRDKGFHLYVPYLESLHQND